MKQRLCNRILAVYNSIIYLAISVLNIIITNNSNLKYQFNSTPHTDDFQNSIYFFSALLIFTIIVNLIFLIINRKNKKMIYCFIVPILFYIFMSLRAFQLDAINIFNFIAWTIIPIIIINLLYEITRKKNGNSSALQIFGTLICILLIISPLFTSNYDTLIIGIILSSIMTFIYSKEEIETSKAIKILNTILLILLTILLIIGISLFFIAKSNLRKVDDEIDTFLNTIKTGLEQERNLPNDRLIPVCKNNKWGYINTSGKEISACEYDAITLEEDNYYGTPKYDFYILKKGNEFSIISNSGKILYKQDGAPTPWDRVYFQNKYDSPYRITSEFGSTRRQIQHYIYPSKNVEYIDSSNNTVLKYNDDSNYDVYSFDVGDDYILEFKEIDSNDSYTNYNMALKADGKTIENYNNVSVPNIYELETYSNGDIPFYNLENKLQGYYSRKNHKFEILNGKYEILDIIDDRVLIKNWTDSSNTKDMIVDREKGILLKADFISTYKNGYLVKKENGKSVLLDKNLNALTDEYDVIFDTYKNYGVFICLNINTGKNEYVLVDSQGQTLTNMHYDIIYYDYNPNFDEIHNKDYVIYDLHNAYEKQYATEDF